MHQIRVLRVARVDLRRLRLKLRAHRVDEPLRGGRQACLRAEFLKDPLALLPAEQARSPVRVRLRPSDRDIAGPQLRREIREHARLEVPAVKPTGLLPGPHEALRLLGGERQIDRHVGRDTFGRFDAVASLGAFGHFCSPEDYRAGRQHDIYRDVFARVASVLPVSGRLYLQSMVFGRNMIPMDEVSIAAPRDSDARYLALMQHQFPGSFLPLGREQVIRAAEPYCGLVESSSGRLDYIETIKRWRARFANRSLRKTVMKARLVPRDLTSREFRLAFTSGVSANSVCFERELLDHLRLVFEKR